MTSETLFRILTPEGLLSYDVFTLVQPQPGGLKRDCVAVVDQNNGRQMTVHQTRLVPWRMPGPVAADGHHKSVCLKCGRVEGVVQEQIPCPHHHDGSCGLIEAGGGQNFVAGDEAHQRSALQLNHAAGRRRGPF